MEELTAQLVLQEIRGVRDDLQAFKNEVSEWKQELGERVASVETTIRPAIQGNGQPSRLSAVETRVTALEKMWWKAIGAAVAVWTILTTALHFLPWGR
jgi:hypothetical protein